MIHRWKVESVAFEQIIPLFSMFLLLKILLLLFVIDILAAYLVAFFV